MLSDWNLWSLSFKTFQQRTIPASSTSDIEGTDNADLTKPYQRTEKVEMFSTFFFFKKQGQYKLDSKYDEDFRKKTITDQSLSWAQKKKIQNETLTNWNPIIQRRTEILKVMANAIRTIWRIKKKWYKDYKGRSKLPLLTYYMVSCIRKIYKNV